MPSETSWCSFSGLGLRFQCASPPTSPRGQRGCGGPRGTPRGGEGGSLNSQLWTLSKSGASGPGGQASTATSKHEKRALRGIEARASRLWVSLRVGSRATR